MANRTKHKPANSGQAARLLGTQPVFLSFDEASRALLSGPDSSPPPADSGISLDAIDPDFQTIFRHLTKKDSNTKLKALQDFVQLIEQKDPETLDRTAGYWQRMYRKLSNSTDSKIRFEAHKSHKSFITNLSPETVGRLYSVKIDDPFEIQTSFQKLVTLPAVLWTSCCDRSPQAAEASKNLLNHLYSSPEERLQFLIDNHVTILHYCVYTLFYKIPVDLFYSTALSKEARQVFDEHLLVTSLMGLSTLINQLLSLENKDRDKEAECERCLRTIFDVINREFLKSKQVFAQSQAQSGDAPSTSEQSSKDTKEKKTKKKGAGVEKGGDGQKPDDNAFKFWTYEKIENFSVRTAFYSFLNSLTRLTTRLLLDGESSRPDSDGTILWFKLYKNVFLTKVFYAFSDNVAQVRGNAWLLVTHILLHHQEFKPWSVVSHEKWKKDVLVPFIENGCKPREGIMDFGLINIVEKSVFPELFSKKFPNQSAYKMICDGYSLTNVVENVKLITVFADAYQEAFDVNKEDVYVTLISAFNSALLKVFLQSDAKFLAEVYFNLVYHFVIRNSSQNDIESLSRKFKEIFHVGMKSLFSESFENNQDILSNSHLSLNLLIMVRNVTNDYKQHPATFSHEVFELFKTSILKVYSDILIYSTLWLPTPFQEKDYSGFRNYLKSLNFLFFLQRDGYFSCEYYYLRTSTDYMKNFFNIYKSRSASEQAPKEKKVQFQVDDEEKDAGMDLSPEDKAFGHVSLFNPSFSDFKADSRAFLPDEFHVLLEKFSVMIAQLFKKLDEELGYGLNECCMTLLYHLQYYYRIFEFYTKEHFLREMGLSTVNELIEQYVMKWVRLVVEKMCKKEHCTSFKLEMTILQKLFDCILIMTPLTKDDHQFLSDLFFKMDSFPFILFIEHLEKLKDYPFSIRYDQRLRFFRLSINENIYLRSLQTEVEKILSGEVRKIQLVNMTKLLNTYLGQCKDSNKLENALNMLCAIATSDCFNISQANWYHTRMACIFQKITEQINLGEVSNLDRLSTNLIAIVKYLLDKCLLSNCSSDFTSEQFETVLSFVRYVFNLCSIFGPKIGPVLEEFFEEITKQDFYSENSERLEFMEKVFNLGLDCLKMLPETSAKSQQTFVDKLEAVTVDYRDDVTPILYATEGDDAELKLLAFYELLATDRYSLLLKPDFMDRIRFETITSQFKAGYFYYQALILNRLLSEMHQKEADTLLANPSGTILQSLKNLFKVYFYFEHAFIVPMSQNSITFEKARVRSNNVQFGLFNEQLANCVETLTKSDPELKMKLFAYVVDIENNQLKNILISFFLNQHFFFLDFSEIFESFGMNEEEIGLMLLNFLENRDYEEFIKKFEEFNVPDSCDEFKHRTLSTSEHQKMLLISYLLVWETSGDEPEVAQRLKSIFGYMKTTRLLYYIKNHPEEKVILSLFAKLVSEIATNSLRQIGDFQIFYDMISCLVAAIQKTMTQMDSCLDYVVSSRVLKALIDCNQEACKQISRLPILDWKIFASSIAHNIILKCVYQTRDFVPQNFIQDVFHKRVAHTVEWFDEQTIKMAPKLDVLSFESGTKLELEEKLDKLISEKKLVKADSSQGQGRQARKNMETGSPFHDSVLSLYFGILFHPNLQWNLAAYHVLSRTLQDLNRVMPEDCKTAPQDFGDSEDMGEDEYLEPFQVVAAYLRKLDAATHVIFDEYEFAEEVLLEPKTDLYDYSLAYLLFWKLYLELINSFQSTTVKAEQVRNNLIQFVTDNKFHENLLHVLYNLMMNVEENLDPEDDEYAESFSVQNIEAIFKQLDQVTKFSDLKTLFRGKHISLLPRLAQIVYYQCLKTLPGIVRSWAAKNKKPDRELIDGFTLKYFTGPLISSEYDRFHGEKEFGNISIRFNKRDKDIFLVYSKNEISLKIKFSFPANYPLAQLGVECLDHSGATDDQTKDWIHRIIVFFSKHNCSIRDAIVMLKPNMDKFFENFEECMICLFMLQGVNKELPRLRCPQCRKKFHRTCMDRWFHTSNQRTCPQCKYEFKIGA